jgi:hypothetical protein
MTPKTVAMPTYDKTPITVSMRPDADADDPLADAEARYKAEHPGLAGWDLCPRYSDDQRDEILLTVPAWSLPSEDDDR